MTVFLAGAAGAVGRPLSLKLVAAGHRVVGTTRSADKAAWLTSIGVEPTIVDVYDAAALKAAVVAARPEVVLHQLTDLPQVYDPATFPSALAGNARVRDEGTRNLVAAALAAGARRLIGARSQHTAGARRDETIRQRCRVSPGRCRAHASLRRAWPGGYHGCRRHPRPPTDRGRRGAPG